MKPTFNDIPNVWAWAEKLGYFWPNYQHYFGTVSPLSMGKWIWLFFLKKTMVLGPNTYIPNMILSVKNLGNSHHTSVFGDI